MPFDSTSPSVPHARTSPPWCFCGDRASADFGTLFARHGAGGAVVLSFDAAGAQHAATLHPPAILGPEHILHGRRFDVRWIAESPAR